jgi:O-glycosyl hydrolase
MGANAGMEWSIDVWEVEESAILGNSIAWRRRMLFSQEAGDRGFSLQRVLI